jgi:hypothetical protein
MHIPLWEREGKESELKSITFESPINRKNKEIYNIRIGQEGKKIKNRGKLLVCEPFNDDLVYKVAHRSPQESTRHFFSQGFERDREERKRP